MVLPWVGMPAELPFYTFVRPHKPVQKSFRVRSPGLDTYHQLADGGTRPNADGGITLGTITCSLRTVVPLSRPAHVQATRAEHARHVNS